MTTITNNELTDDVLEYVLAVVEDRYENRKSNAGEDDRIILALRELQKRRKASKEPVRYLNKFSGVCVTLEQQPNASDDVAVYMPLYAAPPVQETGIYKDMLNIISLLEKNEWAEHCTSTVLGSLLESEITRLVSKEQPTPVVPDECPDELLAFCEQVIDSRITANAKADELWNACRAAMLQANQRDLSQPVDPQVADYEKTMLQAGWVMAPVEPTEEMIAAAMECEDVLFNSDGEFCVQFREIYCAMVDAAPKPETGTCTK
ncbi:TPA: hypothetical protein ACISVY_000298 [Salmonella enterica subsp. enterica serovar Orientalis]